MCCDTVNNVLVSATESAYEQNHCSDRQAIEFDVGFLCLKFTVFLVTASDEESRNESEIYDCVEKSNDDNVSGLAAVQASEVSVSTSSDDSLAREHRVTFEQQETQLATSREYN
jgi:hypothetical protein